MAAPLWPKCVAQVCRAGCQINRQVDRLTDEQTDWRTVTLLEALGGPLRIGNQLDEQID
jgi:hypothetical protein